MDDCFKILLVDDDELDRMAARRALRASDVEVNIHEEESAEGALETLKQHDFDCILLDFQLPDGDGLYVLRKARAAGISTPVVMLTGHGDEELAVELMK